MMALKSSTSVFTRGSSLQVASSVSTRVRASPEAGSRTETAQRHDAISVNLNGVSLEAVYHIEPDGLRVVVRAFDGHDPNSTQLHDRLLLKPGQRRIIRVRRAHGKPPQVFTITCLGEAVQISAKDA
jgi:hypothetical protein